MKNKEKPLKIVLEGCDCSGKSTFYKELIKMYKNIEFMDRCLVSDIVYAEKFNRDIYLGIPIKTYIDFWKYWHKENVRLCHILFTASPETLAKRAIEKEEQFCRNRTYDQIQEYLYKDDIAFKRTTIELYKDWGFDFIEINTDEDYTLNMQKIVGYINGKLSV